MAKEKKYYIRNDEYRIQVENIKKGKLISISNPMEVGDIEISKKEYNVWRDQYNNNLKIPIVIPNPPNLNTNQKFKRYVDVDKNEVKSWLGI
jgi:hypothetical protein